MKNHQKGFIAPLVIVIVALLVIGGGVYVYNKNDSNSENSSIKGVGGTKLVAASQSKIAEDTARCNREIGQQEKDTCFNYAAGEDQEPALCEKIQTQFTKDECYNSFADLTKEASYCNKIQQDEMKKNCTMALNNVGKPGYRITSTSWQGFQICNPDQIEKQSQDIKDSCYEEFAREYKDVNFCSKIQMGSTQQRCYDVVAVVTKNSDICKKRGTEDTQDQCYAGYAAAIGSEYCELIKSGSNIQEKKDNCYQQAAMLKHDVKVCQKVSEPNLRQFCVTEASK